MGQGCELRNQKLFRCVDQEPGTVKGKRRKIQGVASWGWQGDEEFVGVFPQMQLFNATMEKVRKSWKYTSPRDSMERYAEWETESPHVSSLVLSPCNSRAGGFQNDSAWGCWDSGEEDTESLHEGNGLLCMGSKVSNRRFIIRSRPSSLPAPHLPLSLQLPQSKGRGNVFW